MENKKLSKNMPIGIEKLLTRLKVEGFNLSDVTMDFDKDSKLYSVHVHTDEKKLPEWYSETIGSNIFTAHYLNDLDGNLIKSDEGLVIMPLQGDYIAEIEFQGDMAMYRNEMLSKFGMNLGAPFNKYRQGHMLYMDEAIENLVAYAKNPLWTLAEQN